MAQYLRDVHIANIKITEDVLTQLTEVFASRAQPLLDAADHNLNDDKKPFLTFIIRFDGKGYRLFSLEELLRHFKRATEVERIIITIETPESLRSNRLVGEHLDIRLDKLEEKNCYLSVTSDDSDWVEASYSAVTEVLNKYKTKNGWARSGWSTLTIQLLGVIAGFALSLWAALRIAPKLSIESAFVITFFFALLIFSNAWGYINTIVLNRVHKIFPNIQFYRPDKDRINWLIQGLIVSVATALMLYVFSLVFTFIGDFLRELPK
jgi:hypothetical protein